MITLSGIEGILKRADQAAQLNGADLANIAVIAHNAFQFVDLNEAGQRSYRSAVKAIEDYAGTRFGYGRGVNSPMNETLRQDAWRAYRELQDLHVSSPKSQMALNLGL